MVVVVTPTPAEGEGTVPVTQELPNSDLWDDILDTYIRVFANPYTLVLFMLGNVELALLLTDSKLNVYTYIINLIKTLMADELPAVLVSLLTTFSDLLNYLQPLRIFCASAYLLVIPTVLKERDLITYGLIQIMMYVFTNKSYLEQLVYSHVWLHFNSLTRLHRTIVVFSLAIALYYNIVSFKPNSTHYSNVKNLLSKVFKIEG
nr:movement protein [Recilia dorsalis filamentous virus]